MLKYLSLFLLIVFLFIFGSIASGQCRNSATIKECRVHLTPYRFSGAAETQIIIDSKSKVLDLEFTAYESERYRLIFCTTGDITSQIKVVVYDGRKNNPNRKKVFESESGKQSQDLFWIFEPERTGNYFIEYEVPASTNGSTQEGCMNLIIGYTSVAN